MTESQLPEPTLADLPLFADPTPHDPTGRDGHTATTSGPGGGGSAGSAGRHVGDRAAAASALAGPTTRLPSSPAAATVVTGALADLTSVPVRAEPFIVEAAPSSWELQGPESRNGAPNGAGSTVHAGPGAAAEDDGIDWALVRAFRQKAAAQLSAALLDRVGVNEAAQHDLGRRIVLDLLSEQVSKDVKAGAPTFSPHEQERMATAVFDSLFRMGRLQPLVDDEQVENIEIGGYDNVILEYADGTLKQGPPVAESDEELIETLAFIAARSRANERPFSPTIPSLHLRLDGGERLAAAAWTTPRPSVVIRRHRLRVVTLDDLVQRRMMDRTTASLLAAAVRAKKSIVISGPQGAGKTTLLRALCSELDPWERIGTVETEFELHLHELTDQHKRIVAWESRPGSGERGPDGRAAGEITLDQLVWDSFRFNLSRFIVGEVRGPEVFPMLKAMQGGAGSMSTTHASNARAAIERLVTCAMEAGSHVTEGYAYRQVATHIDLIVQIGVDFRPGRAGQPPVRERYVAEVIHVERGEKGPSVTDLYKPGIDGRGVAHILPEPLVGLSRFGFDVAAFNADRDRAVQL